MLENDHKTELYESSFPRGAPRAHGAWVRLALVLAWALGVLPAVGCRPATKPSSEEERALHALGFRLGTNLAPLRLSPRELAIVQAGLEDAAEGRAPAPDKKSFEALQALLHRRGAARSAEEARKGPDLIAEAARQPGASTLPSGVVFRELVGGTGAAAPRNGKVKVHLRGTLGDGTVIEDTRERGDPMVLPVGEVMACWADAIERMRVGGTARVVCPPATAFAELGRPPMVPPNSTVIYELEVVDARP